MERLMAKDSLLQEKFFYSLSGDDDLTDSLQREEVEILNLIKQSLYTQGEEPVYYQGRYNNFKDLNAFIDQPEFIELQRQLTLIVEQLKAWGRDHELLNLEKTLEDFLVKLKLTGATEKITLLYGEGKKSLEIIAVLLNDPQIDLELRKTIFIDLLADNELAKCIDGCYTRISTAAQRLLEQRDNKNQINRWIRNYSTDKARKIAAKRPIAMPESYQRLICRVLGIPFRTNELHASNYLLNQAKEKGFAINLIPDVGAKEIGRQLDHLNRREIVNLYLTHLESKVTASDLVDFISRRLHADFNKIMEDKDRDYVEKIAAIETKLQLIGSDNGFLLNEIFEEEFWTLKPASALTITIQNRLTQRKWLYAVEKKSFELSGKRFFYYHFPRNLELNWYFQEGDTSRTRYIELLNPGYLNTDENSLKTSLLFKFLDLPDFIVHSREILTVLKYNKLSFPIIDFLSDNRLIDCLIRITDPLRFSQIIKSLSLEKGESILKKMHKLSIQAVINKAISLADVELRFDYLPPDYFIKHYNQVAQQDALKLTKQLLVNVIEKGFRDFSNYIVFRSLRHTDYLNDIDFSGADLSNAAFMQSVYRCSFKRCKLTNTLFQKNLRIVSFAEVDLQNTIFSTENFIKYENIDLRNAKLSSSVFESFLTAGITDFSYSDLSLIDFQNVLKNKKLGLDFSYANLQGVDLSSLDLKKIKFYSSDMSYTNLAHSMIRPVSMQNVKLQGAHLSLLMVYDFNQQGVKQFDECVIYQVNISDFPESFTLQKASFKKAIFKSPLIGFTMLECDLTEAHFIAEVINNYGQLTRVDFQKTKFIKTEFKDIRISNVQFTDCIIQDLKFLNVKLPSNILFKFYSLGHRDFSQVKELKGHVTEKLSAFPLSEAKLSKEVFIHLYKQGVRDFRASNLNSFYLGQVLREQAISSINLKLGGANYKKTILSCVGGNNQQRKRTTILDRCDFFFLIQKQGLTERQLFLEDIRQTFEESMPYLNFLFEEIVLDQSPLFVLKNPRKITFYWAYIPQEGSFDQIINFMFESTRSSDRPNSQIEYYFTKKISSIENIKKFADKLINLGFIKGQINYYNVQGQLLALDLQGKSIVLTQHSRIDEKLLGITQTKKNILTLELFDKKEERSRFYRIAADMQRRSKAMLRSGIKEGAHYEIGYIIMYFVSSWLMQKKTTIPQLLDIETKNRLKQVARNIIKKEADSKRAGQYVRDLLERVVSQCIEQGECYDEALVRADIVDNLNEIKPDIQVGYEVMWQKIKGIFLEIGKFFTTNYRSIQGYFLFKSMKFAKRNVIEDRNMTSPTLIQITQNSADEDKIDITEVSSNFSTHESFADSSVCLSNQPWFDADEIETTNTTNYNISIASSKNQSIESFFYFNDVARHTKRQVHNWSENPLILRLIKAIIICFDLMGFELYQDTQFSEENLACLLYDIGLVLDKCAITHTSPTDILNLFQNAYFWQSVLNRSERYDFAVPRTELPAIELSENKFLEDSLDVFKATNESLIKKKEKRHVQFFNIGSMNTFTNSPSSSADRTTFWLANWVIYFLRIILSIKEVILSSATLHQYYPDISFFNHKCIYPQIKQINNDKSSLQIFFSNFDINNGLILADFFLKCYVARQPKKKNKLKKNNHFLRNLKAITIASARENNIRLSDVYNPWLLKNLSVSQSYCYNNSVKNSIFLYRNKLCQWMDFKQLTRVKKFRFLNSFDLNVNEFFFIKDIFYPNDFPFFKKSLENSDLYFTCSNESLVKF